MPGLCGGVPVWCPCTAPAWSHPSQLIGPFNQGLPGGHPVGLCEHAGESPADKQKEGQPWPAMVDVLAHVVRKDGAASDTVW